MRPRKIIKYGNSFFIKLIPTDMTDLSLELGDEVDIEDISKLNHKEKRK